MSSLGVWSFENEKLKFITNKKNYIPEFYADGNTALFTGINENYNITYVP